MKNVRILYKKQGRTRFISHLDTTRVMARVLRLSKIPIWFTEGFNPHPYITFALPLPLGFSSDYEVMDIRILDDNFPLSEVPQLLSRFAPDGIVFYDCFEAQKKAGDVFAAQYKITFDDKGELEKAFSEFLRQSPLLITKKTKRGDQKEIDVAPHIRINSVSAEDDTEVALTLPAGGVMNINPELILTAFFESGKSDYYCYSVRKTAVFDKENKPFR